MKAKEYYREKIIELLKSCDADTLEALYRVLVKIKEGESI